MEVNEYILFVAVMLITPLALAGVYKLTMMIMEKLMVRNGCIKTFFITRNHRLRHYFVKPIAGLLKIKNRTFNFNDASGYVIQDGSSPSAFYNEKTAQQLDMTNIEKHTPVDPDHYSDLLIRAYNLGKTADMKKDNMVMIAYLTLIGIVLVIAIGLLTFVSVGGLGEAIAVM